MADATNSIVASACFYLIVQIMMFNALIENGLSGTEKVDRFGGMCVTLGIDTKKWEKEVRKIQKKINSISVEQTYLNPQDAWDPAPSSGIFKMNKCISTQNLYF